MAAKKGVLQEIEGKSGRFALVFLLLFGLTFGFLALVGATPESTSTTDTNTTGTDSTGSTLSAGGSLQTAGTAQPTRNPAPANRSELPTRIVVKKIDLDVTVANPTSTNVETLDKYLLKGAVRYPTSGTLGENGTVLLFGHSSYLPVVHNPAYKAFDGIQNLKQGDIISVYSGSVEYQFSVTGVHVADANNDTVPLPQDAQHLTLVTCDSFASKSNRFVVTADLVGTFLSN